MKKVTYFILALFFLFSCINTEKKNEIKKPKNIILMIGDGMGTAQLYSAYVANKGFANYERCQYTGFSKTYSSDHLITDSGAGGTALACGIKTNNKFIGMTPDSIPINSILHYAEMNNKATGLVATSSVTHATPASFIAHEPLRYDYDNIAADFLDTDIDVFIGGGLLDFTERKDKRNLVDSLRAKDYEIALNLNEVMHFNGQKLAGLLYDKHPNYLEKGRGDMLRQSSLKAIEILNKNQNGFFLMIEASQIDWAGHFKDSELNISEVSRDSKLYEKDVEKFTDLLVKEVQDFDNTIGAVLDFAEKDGETLVIIVADHETGGFAITDGSIEKGEVIGEFESHKDHTAVMVPVLAFGPQAERFVGFMENIDIFTKMYEAYGFDPKALNN